MALAFHVVYFANPNNPSDPIPRSVPYDTNTGQRIKPKIVQPSRNAQGQTAMDVQIQKNFASNNFSTPSGPKNVTPEGHVKNTTPKVNIPPSNYSPYEVSSPVSAGPAPTASYVPNVTSVQSGGPATAFQGSRPDVSTRQAVEAHYQDVMASRQVSSQEFGNGAIMPASESFSRSGWAANTVAASQSYFMQISGMEGRAQFERAITPIIVSIPFAAINLGAIPAESILASQAPRFVSGLGEKALNLGIGASFVGADVGSRISQGEYWKSAILSAGLDVASASFGAKLGSTIDLSASPISSSIRVTSRNGMTVDEPSGTFYPSRVQKAFGSVSQEVPGSGKVSLPFEASTNRNLASGEVRYMAKLGSTTRMGNYFESSKATSPIEGALSIPYDAGFIVDLPSKSQVYSRNIIEPSGRSFSVSEQQDVFKLPSTTDNRYSRFVAQTEQLSFKQTSKANKGYFDSSLLYGFGKAGSILGVFPRQELVLEKPSTILEKPKELTIVDLRSVHKGAFLEKFSKHKVILEDVPKSKSSIRQRVSFSSELDSTGVLKNFISSSESLGLIIPLSYRSNVKSFSNTKVGVKSKIHKSQIPDQPLKFKSDIFQSPKIPSPRKRVKSFRSGGNLDLSIFSSFNKEPSKIDIGIFDFKLPSGFENPKRTKKGKKGRQKYELLPSFAVAYGGLKGTPLKQLEGKRLTGLGLRGFY